MQNDATAFRSSIRRHLYAGVADWADTSLSPSRISAPTPPKIIKQAHVLIGRNCQTARGSEPRGDQDGSFV